ncbi:MAG: TlpA disulfide reductase family protein, partial [Eubacteriales bacterium]|nr:TlpA disulfide reductase family protein [Eubacteriales bacterium]
DMKKDDMKKDGMKHDDMKEHTMMNEGEAAPDFTLTGLDGKTYRLADLKGKKVYLKFWASWCSICLSTLQDTDELAAKAGDDYVVLSVVAPKVNGEKSEEVFKKWFSTLEYKNLPVAFDQDGKTLEAYGVRSYPSAAFIGSDGVLVKKHIGFMSADEVKETLKQIK